MMDQRSIENDEYLARRIQEGEPGRTLSEVLAEIQERRARRQEEDEETERAWLAQQADPMRAVCEVHEEELWGACILPSTDRYP